MATALITGVGGFIGSHLAERLVVDGWRVIGADNFSTGNPRNIEAIKDQITLYREFGIGWSWPDHEIKFDVIFHLAARVGPSTVCADPLLLLREHHDHAVAICERARRDDAVVVFTSSSEVYQYNTEVPFREDALLVIGSSHLPRCAYAISKLNMEHLALAYHRQGGVRAIVARLFNVAGRRQRPAFVLPIFARQALRSQPITLHGDGQQVRCFTHVDDVVTALIALAATPAAVGEIINVGTAEGAVTMESLASWIAASCPQSVGYQFVPYVETGDAAWEDMRVRIPDVTKLKRLTGLEFGDRLVEIIADVCEDQAEQIEKEAVAA